MIDNPQSAPDQYKDIVHQRYLISKHTNTSYMDTLKITPIERQYIFQFITDELVKQKEAYDKLKNESSDNRRL